MKNSNSHTPPADFRQVAALPLGTGPDGALRVLLLTSRETGRWIIPKGWPMRGLKPHEAAAREALEEAGGLGHVTKKPIGDYHYFKRRTDHFDYCQVDVYLLKVEKQLGVWREQGQRKTEWFPLSEAETLVDEPGLVALLQNLAVSSDGQLLRAFGPDLRGKLSNDVAPRRKAIRKAG
jgi:8-oxo-dGTP pyrophosphatase MutT (NUDIX family)